MNGEPEIYDEEDVKEILIRIIEEFEFDENIAFEKFSVYSLECMIGERIGWLRNG
jgi:hypothetical protein